MSEQIACDQYVLPVEALLHEITDESRPLSCESVPCSHVIDIRCLFLSVCADLLCLFVCFVCLTILVWL